MNMNEQPVGTPLSKNWTQLAEPKEERTRFHLGQESLQREKKNQSRNRKIYSFNLNNMLLLTR